KRSPPSSSSSCLMARVSDGCVTLHVSAALVKLRSLTVARKYLTWCISIAEFYQAVSQLALALGGPVRQMGAKEQTSLQRSARDMTVAVKPEKSILERRLRANCRWSPARPAVSSWASPRHLPPPAPTSSSTGRGGAGAGEDRRGIQGSRVLFPGR